MSPREIDCSIVPKASLQTKPRACNYALRFARGEYLVVLDPLAGSSNTGLNVAVGSIFSVLHRRAGQPVSDAAFLCNGREQLAAGYAIYGPATMLVLTVGLGTHGFTLDRDAGAFLLTHPFIRIPAPATEFSINAANGR